MTCRYVVRENAVISSHIVKQRSDFCYVGRCDCLFGRQVRGSGVVERGRERRVKRGKDCRIGQEHFTIADAEHIVIKWDFSNLNPQLQAINSRLFLLKLPTFPASVLTLHTCSVEGLILRDSIIDATMWEVRSRGSMCECGDDEEHVT